MIKHLRIYISGDLNSDWYPKNAIQMFKKYSTFEFVNSPNKAHIIWKFSYGLRLNRPVSKPNWLKLAFNQLSSTKIIGPKNQIMISSFHHLYQPKEDHWLNKVKATDSQSDLIHFFSKKNALENIGYFKNPIFVLPYWIETTKFKPLSIENKKSIKLALNIPNNKIIIGSFQRDTEKDLVSPKLEKGPDIFCDIVENLNKDKIFILLAGPRRNYVTNRLQKANIEYLNLGHIEYQKMNELYNAINYYLVTSRVEGGPQAILESMASGTPIYSTPVGISNLLEKQVVHRKINDFVESIQKDYPSILDSHLKQAKQFDVSNIIKCYEQNFINIYESFINKETSYQKKLTSIDWFNTKREAL